MVTTSDQQSQPEPTDRRRFILSVVWSLLIFVLCLFLPAGTLAWSRGWLFFVVTVAASILIDRPWSHGHRQRSIRHRSTSGLRVGIPGLHRHGPVPWLLVGIDPRSSGVPAPGCANDLGGPNFT
jgi:hypothetical protein